MNKPHFSDQMAILGSAFQVDVAPMLAVYWADLSGYTDQQFEQAAIAHRRTGKFFPRIADLIELIDGTSKENAHEAWAAALIQLKDSANAKFSPATAKAIRAIGAAQYLGQMSYKDLEFKKRDFIEVYESKAATESVPAIE